MPNGHHVYLDGPMVGTLQKVVTSTAQQSLEFEPGEKFFYRGLGFETRKLLEWQIARSCLIPRSSAEIPHRHRVSWEIVYQEGGVSVSLMHGKT